MSSDRDRLEKELVLLIIQYLGDERYEGAMHMLEQESGYHFSLKYFEKKILNGEWDELEKYISGFTKFYDNGHSTKLMFEISKQKYYEALERNNNAEAVDILVKELRKFAPYNQQVYKDLTELLTLNNFRENPHLCNYTDNRSARVKLVISLTEIVKDHPLLKNKLQFPEADNCRLRKLINMSLNWQHLVCTHPAPFPVIESLCKDHRCSLPAVTAAPKPRPFADLFAAPPPQPSTDPLAAPPPQSFADPSPSVERSIVPYQARGKAVASPDQPGTTLASVSEAHPSFTYFTAIDRMGEELQLGRNNAEGVSRASNQLRTSSWMKFLPLNVAYTVRERSKVTSLEFHPYNHMLLLVGTENGEFSIWELKSRQMVASESFKIRDAAPNSLALQLTTADEDARISVTRVTWSPDADYFGIAFTKDLIHVYAHSGINDILHCLEINAHDGCVNDLAFDHRNKETRIISCGDDKLIKVWSIGGQNLFKFEGNEAPVFSVCPHHSDGYQFIFSTSTDGKIRCWMYDYRRSISNCDAPGGYCTTLAFSKDGSKMITSGISIKGDNFLVQWAANGGILDNEAKTKFYYGLTKKSGRIAHFDIADNIIAVGEDSQIKYWHIDHHNVLTSTNANGRLQCRPRVKFNKDGSFLAATTEDEGFIVLANEVGCIRAGLCPNDSEAGTSRGANVNVDNEKSGTSSSAMPSSSHLSTRN